MKDETTIKIANRYIKNLRFLENEAKSNGQPQDAERYKIDRQALENLLSNFMRKE